VHTDQRLMPDWGWVHTELRRTGVSLALLWQEYRLAEWLRDGLNLIIGWPTDVGKPGSPARWPTRPAGAVTACDTCAYRV